MARARLPQRISRRGILAAAGVSAAGPILAACAGPWGPGKAPEQAPGAPQAGAPTTIVVWAGGLTAEDIKTPQGQWAKWVRENFQEKFPKYKLQGEDHGWDQALRTGLLTAIAGGNMPEVTTGEAFVHEFAALGAFAPVPGLSVKHFAYGPVAGSVYKGQLYGVPIYTSPFALETNRRVAEKAGIDPSKPPKNWDDLVLNSDKAAKAGAGNYFGFNLYGPAPNRIYGTVLRTIPWINQTGKPLGDDDGTKAFFNSPEHVAAYELSRKLFKTADPGNSFSGDEGKLYAYLWQDKALYQASATWNAYNAQEAGGDSVFHPLPRQNAGVSGNVVLGNEVYSPLAKAKNRDGALDFVKFMAEPATQRQVGQVLGFRLPTVAEVLKDPQLERLPAYQAVPAAMRVFADILLTEDVRPVPPYSKNADKIWIAWGDAFGKILQTSDPVKPILDSLQADVERLIR
jgi:ABC-type glycerol-3-phosphate transport system substrate-binding protein